ncbi:DUF397 domain-containing protein [Streptomyces lonarensis]|uniref:DUF397 domain-containing protein n=1 Tax=Streptomyces lonarensis TaxID=700599 RepID=A0A7X6D102_9ACTN|nr:DUF397 domain-containing protein [Streptomyces lonarensis]NJQ06085.1 DUF397 domain-containing protein [Streptomyces lonarensis]
MLHASVDWFSSSYSGNGGNCIEVATNLVATHGTIPVRDSKNPDGPVLELSATAFAAFINGVKPSAVIG